MSSLQVNLNERWNQETLGSFAENATKKAPFQVLVYSNLLDEQSFTTLRSDVKANVRVKKKDNDLYKFKQSKDMKSELTTKKLTPIIESFIDAMLDQVRPNLEDATGLKLSSKYFDITASRYDKGDYLLCHNDDIKDSVKQHRRALAFIYYMNTRLWTRDDGGALILYDSDDTGEPVTVNNLIEPKPNTLVVFRTSSTSWHSVEEVYNKDDTRLSINGWFHIEKPGKIEDKVRETECSLYKFLRPKPLNERAERFFQECVNGEYLMEKTCYLIRRKFKRKSEINLINFLVKEKYDEMSAALKEAVKNEENLSHVGPYNKRNYKIIKIGRLPQICQDLYEAFRSELFFMLVARLTGLDLQPPNLCDPKDQQAVESDDDDDDEDEESESDDDDDVDNLEDEESSEDDTKVDGSELRAKVIQEKGESSKSDENILEQVTKTKEEIVKERSPKKLKSISDPLARLEMRQFEPGSYTLIHDYGYELAEKSALDVILHFNHDFAVNFDEGGYISYLDGTEEDDLHDMDCELLTIEPKSNCLSLAYRCGEGTCRFLKYITKSHRLDYQDLSCVFYEKPDDLPRANDASVQ